MTQAMLARGSRLTEILKQGQYVPMPVEKQILSIYAATNNWLKDYPLTAVRRYEREMLSFVEANHPDILTDIRTQKKLSDELKARIDKALESFKGTFDPEAKN